jgi:dihydroxy-acid dehydratase
LSVANRELSLLVSEVELAERKAAKPLVVPTAQRGYRKLFLENVTQADRGVDFEFLMPPMTGKIPKNGDV